MVDFDNSLLSYRMQRHELLPNISCEIYNYIYIYLGLINRYEINCLSIFFLVFYTDCYTCVFAHL